MQGHSPAPPPGISASPSPAAVEPSGPSSSVNGAPSHQSAFAQAESSRAPAGYSQSPRKDQTVLESLMQSFGVAKDMADRRASDPNELHSSLDVSYHNAPAQVDAEP